MDRTTRETRRQSYDAVLPKREKRCRLILETLGAREMTASEITEELVAAGEIPYFNRNYVAPRLTEMKQMGILKTVGRRKATRSDATEAVWARVHTAATDQTAAAPADNPTTYMNDPSAIVARAFAELYPGIDYHAQFVPDLCDESGNRAFGLTIFPDDGSTPIVCISAEAPISAAPELLAHELAHVATPEDKDHGEAWQTAEKAIGDKYDEILNHMIPDDDPGVLVPHEAGDGGILAMPLRDNIPDPGRDDWKLTTCPVCGAECWETEIARQALAAEPELRAACTACAIRGGRSGR